MRGASTAIAEDQHDAPEVSSALARVVETNRALLRPRRAIPFLIVGAPMVYAQHALGAEPLGVVLAILLAIAFFFLAPAAYRVAFAPNARASFVARLGLYVALPIVLVGALAVLAPDAFGMGPTFLTRSSSVAVLLGLFVVGGWGLGRDVELEVTLARERERARRIEQAAEQAQLLALHRHLEPHFLFNTLNAIAEWCREDGEVAERAILQLSSMLRAITEAVRIERWPLARELELVAHLFDLHAIRDAERFQVARAIDEASLTALVPPLLLLPLAENAMKHGPAAGHRGVVALALTGDATTLRLRLTNPGAYRGPRAGGTGLTTLRARLALVYGDRARLALRAEGDTTVTELEWPRDDAHG